MVLFDAVTAGGESGTIHRVNIREQAVPAGIFGYSTHHFSIAEAVELARAMNMLPDQLVLYGIEGESFAIGEGLSTPVQDAIPEVLRRVEQEISKLCSPLPA